MCSPAAPYILRSIAVLSVIVCFASAGCDGKKSSSNTTADLDPPRRIHALGRLEPAGGIISVTGIPGEQVKELYDGVEVNELVPVDGILGVLAGYDLLETQLDALRSRKALTDTKRQHELAIADAKLAQAEANLAQAEASKLKLELQQGKIEALGEASEIAKEELTKLKVLQDADGEVVTDHQIRKQENQVDLAQQEHHVAHKSYQDAIDAAQKAVAAAEAGLEAAKATRKLAEQGLESTALGQEIKVAEETLKRNVLLAPFVVDAAAADIIERVKSKGKPRKSEDYEPYTILKQFVRPGESITQSPVLKLGNLTKMVCIAEVYESDAPKIEPPMKVEIESSALGDKVLRGKAVKKGSLIAPPGVTSRNPLAPADRSVVEVRIEIDKADVEIASKLVGLQVTVKFGDEPKPVAGDKKSIDGEKK